MTISAHNASSGSTGQYTVPSCVSRVLDQFGWYPRAVPANNFKFPECPRNVTLLVLFSYPMVWQESFFLM